MIPIRRAAALLALGALSLPGCLSAGHLNLLGYSTKPLYNCNIKTVYVPIFKNTTSRDSVRQGIEFNLTRAVIQEIEQKSHYKVVSDPACADSELLGTIVMVNKGLLNINQNNEIRMGQTIMNVEIIWRDRRTGEILSSPKANQPDALPFQTPSLPAPNAYPGMTPPIITSTPSDGIPMLTSPVDPDAPPLDKPKPRPALVSSMASYIPELGQSTTTSLQGNIDLLATQIVSMMEAPW